MATNALTLAGTTSGIDTKALIASLVALERQPERAIQQRQLDDQTKLSTLGFLISGLQGLQGAADALNLSSAIKSVTAYSSVPNLVGVVATGTASVGAHSVIVAQLAQAQTSVSSQFNSDSVGVAGAGSVQFTIGNGAPVTVAYGLNDTLDDIAARISAASAGVTASVLFDGSNYQIVVQGTQTGAAGAVAIADPNLNFKTVTAAQDAKLTVDGLSVTRATNSVSDVLPGVTLTLQSTTPPGSPATVTIQNDPAGLRAKVKTIVDAFNSVAGTVSGQLAYSGTTRGGDTLFGDPAIESLQRQMGSLFDRSYSDAKGSISPGDLGISINKDGTLTLDAAKFDAAASKDPAAVQRLLLGHGTDGLVSAIDTLSSQFTDVGTGALPSIQSSINDELKSFADQIQQIEDSANNLQQRLTQQFAAMDAAVSALHTQTSTLTSLFSSLGG